MSIRQMEISEEVKELYVDESQSADKQIFKLVTDKFNAEEDKLATEKEFISLVGKVTAEDLDSIETAWKDILLQPEEDETEDNSLPGWAVALIVIGSILVVAAGAAVPVVIFLKKKAEAKREAEAVVNAYRRKKIDTTDDKTIDVYADEEEKKAEEPAEETEAKEEVTEEPVAEAGAEESAEAEETDNAENAE